MCIVFVLMLSILCVESRAVTGKALLCRDPDTGKLHTVNSSWPSSTFCGNYHCRLRKKNVTENDFEPIKQNLTNFDVEGNIPKLEILFNNDTYFQRQKTLDTISVTKTDKTKGIKTNPERKSPNLRSLDGDRYLTDNEIKTISEILHTVKKSDLEAIVEIYQLAQNIYDELDKVNPESLIHETVHDLNSKNPKLLKEADKKRISYWYDPISNNKNPIPNNKEQPVNVVKLKPYIDLNNIKSNPVKVTTTKPMKPATASKTISYFDGALTTKDFGRLPYYYPVSTFQRLASYIHHPLVVSKTPYVPPTTKAPEAQTTKAPSKKYQKGMKPSIYLPYPFFNVPHNYNWTSPQTVYHSKNYIERYDMSKDSKNVLGRNAVLINPDLENIQELGLKPVAKRERSLSQDKSKEEKPVHDWQTDPISKTILDEVRAHIDKTRFIKPLSLRKKIKLDRVARVVKLDESNKRNKRNLDANDGTMELYEVYLDKTTCDSNDTVPGFFRYGNLSQPFPECCPQRIGN